MYAIINVGGKQYKAEEGKKIKLDIQGKSAGEEVVLNPILFFGADGKISDVSKIKVLAKVVGDVKGKKVIAFKKRPKKGYKKTIGHRQKYTEVEIVKIG